MGKGLAFGASLAGILAVGLLLWRGERQRGPASARAPDGSSSAASALDATEPSASVTREPASPEPARVQSLRGRVLTAEGEPLAGCDARLSYVEKTLAHVETDADGRFEFPGPLREGTGLALVGPEEWNVEPGELELDALPEQELLFVARLDGSEEVKGPVRGVIVDEVEGTPLPYLKCYVAGESLETDAEGRFETTELHPKGPLEIGSSGWDIELDFDPTSREPLRVPARVGPAVYLDIRGEAEKLHAAWSVFPSPAGARAFALQGAGCMLRREAPALVRLPGRERPVEATGEILLSSVSDGLVGRGLLAPGMGTLAAPLPIELQACAFLGVELRTSGRDLEWHEVLELVLTSADGKALASMEASRFGYQQTLFALLDAGDYLVEARLDDEALGQAAAKIAIGDRLPITLAMHVPERPEREAPEEACVPVSGRVTSTRNHPSRGQIRLTRSSDGEEELLELEWTKTRGRWEATFAGEAPVGELRAALELEPCFAYSGPRVLTLPSSDEIHYVLDDAVPLVDVYLEPLAAENGAPLLSYYAELKTDDWHWVGSEDFGSPSLPAAVGHPCNVPFHWLCISAGRGAVSGRYEGRSEGGDVRIPVSLSLGWGAFLYVGDANYEPLDGVEVFLDGTRHGMTDNLGQLALAGARPTTITVRYRDWQIEDGDIEPDGQFDDAQIGMSVYLAPPRR